MFSTNNIIKLIFLFSIVFISSCASNEDSTPNFRESFIGQFSMAETCGTNTDTYTITNSATDVENQVEIGNFYGLTTVKATATSATKLNIPEQVVSLTGSEATISGSGTLSSGRLTLDFTISRPGSSTSTTCTAIGNKM